MSRLEWNQRATVLAFLLLSVTVGCGKSEISAQPLPTPAPTEQTFPVALAQVPPYQPLKAPPATLPPPIINVTDPTATPPPSPTMQPIATATARPIATEALATFTPPPDTNTSPNDHYRLYRPVPEGGTIWTDKVYPYGSTRGGTLRPHHGVEFAVPTGTNILAAQSGTVVAAGNDLEDVYGAHTNFYGGVIIVQHDSAYRGQAVFTLYAHLSEVLVAPGWRVEAGHLIGKSGDTGVANGPHLHFEVRVGENSYNATRNPLLWLYPFKGRGTIAGAVTFANGTQATEIQVTAHRIDGAAPYHGSTTYAVGNVNSDDGWQENFAIDDVRAGYYKVQVRYGDKTYKAETWVYPYQTSFIKLVLSGE